jgi:hypothetical protein
MKRKEKVREERGEQFDFARIPTNYLDRGCVV